MGANINWTEEKIANGFARFIEEHGHAPTSREIDTYPHLPSSRQIQRRYEGGLPALRKRLQLAGPEDFTKGAYSSERARTINKRAHHLEKEVCDYLVGRFGKPYVHREYFFIDDRRTRTDFFIYCKNGNFCVDVFYPKDRHNLINCLNSKMRTYGYAAMLEFPVIFLMMNHEISGAEVTQIIEQKKKKLHLKQHVMTYERFRKYVETKMPLD